MNIFQMIINGEAVGGARTLDVINPATEQVIATCACADAAQIDQAVSAAQAAFPGWAALDIEQRRERLMAIAVALEPHIPDLARLLVSEQGKPLAEAEQEVGATVAMFRVLGSLQIPAEEVSESPAGRIIQHRTPLGVVAAITPWNMPLTLLAVKIVPALLAGCTVVTKPAATTPLASLRLAEICNARLPRGVFNMVVDNNDLGDVLSSHDGVAKISFTGSTATGRKVMASAASAIKRLTLELGGNDAAIVLPDVDVPEVAAKVFAGAMLNAGQICLAVKRVYVHADIHEAFCAELARLADATVIGDGLQPEVRMGPLQNRTNFDKVTALLEDARQHGTIIAGGQRHEGPGFFVQPTIVRDIPEDSRLVREEQFGPLLPVMRFDDTDDVIARANEGEFGLGGTIWTKDVDRGVEMARRIDSGIVWINQHMALNPFVSVGGARQSGLGREMGVEGLLEYTQLKVISAAA